MPRQARVSAKMEKIAISQVRKRGCAVESLISASMVFTFTTAFGSIVRKAVRVAAETLPGFVVRIT